MGLKNMNSHFGTDTAGVNTTRRYLCEALSFQYRYVPIGLLEHLPGRLNDRAPANILQRRCWQVTTAETGSQSLRCFWAQHLNPGRLRPNTKATHTKARGK